MIIVKYGFLTVKNERLEDVLEICNKNSDRVKYVFNDNQEGKHIDILLGFEKEDREFLANLLKNYLRGYEQQYIINRKIDYIRFY